MRLKSYFATTVEAAMALARQELGPDAMLMHSKKATPETRYLGEYEVVFATEQESSGNSAPSPDSPQRDPALDRLADDIGSLKQQVERIAASLGYAAVANGGQPFSRADSAEAFATLVRAGVYPEIARDLLAGSGGSGALAELVRSAVRTECWNGADKRRVAAFIGPPGCGKTTTLAKIAAVYGVAARVPTQIISTDVFRIAAAEQLRTLSSILGAGFQTVESPVALEHALMEHRNKGLILIDTPGLTQQDTSDFEPFARFFCSRPEIEKHVVLPACMKSEDLSRAVDGYGPFGPTHLVFTKLDETSTCGCLLNEVSRTGFPISFLTAGQDIPEHLDPADSGKIADLILGAEPRGTARVSAAA